MKSSKHMTCTDGVSRLGLGLETISVSLGLEGFRSRLGLKGFKSSDFEYCKEMAC